MHYYFNCRVLTIQQAKTMDTKVFEDDSELSDNIRGLKSIDEDECVKTFSRVARQMWEEPSENHVQDVYHQILYRVSFYPAKPSLMKEELCQLGLLESLAERLSSVWAEHAKKIVTARRSVTSEAQGTGYQVLRDVKTQDQRVNLYLQDKINNSTMISFSPTQLFAFYEQLESIQTSIDSICK